jgi:hypothetical protein
VLNDQRVAEFIRQRTQTGERIYVWGTAPGIYYLADRLPVGRYTVAYHLADFDGFSETMAALEQDKPRFIVKLTNENLKFPELEGLLAANYELIKMVGGRQIYLRLIE